MSALVSSCPDSGLCVVVHPDGPFGLHVTVSDGAAVDLTEMAAELVRRGITSDDTPSVPDSVPDAVSAGALRFEGCPPRVSVVDVVRGSTVELSFDEVVAFTLAGVAATIADGVADDVSPPGPAPVPDPERPWW